MDEGDGKVAVVKDRGSSSAPTLTLLKVFSRRLDELEGNELEAALLEASNDRADEATLDAVRLQIIHKISSHQLNCPRHRAFAG